MKLGFIAVFTDELRLISGLPRHVVFTLALPLFLFIFFSCLFQTGIPRDLPVALVDSDNSASSRMLCRMIDNGPHIRLTTRYQGTFQAKAAMQHQDIYGVIEIGPDFEKNLLKGLQNEVVCYTNNQFITPAGLIKKDFSSALGTFSAGLNLKKRLLGNQSPQQAANSIQPVVIDPHVLFNPYTNYAYYLLPAMLPMMFQMVIMILTINVLGTPLKNNLGRQWYKRGNQNGWAALWGKLLPYTIYFIFMGIWMNLLLFNAMKIPSRAPLSQKILFTIFVILIYQLTAAAFVGVSKNLRCALTFGGGYAAIAFSFAAYTFPVEGLPHAIQALAQLFPFTHYMTFFTNRAIRGVPIQLTLSSLMGLVAYLILFLATFPLFINRLKKGAYEKDI